MVKKMNIVTSGMLDEVCGGDGRQTLYTRRESGFYTLLGRYCQYFTHCGLSRSWDLNMR